MWINKKKVMMVCNDMIKGLKEDESRMADYDVGYEMGYINAILLMVKEPSFDLKMLGEAWIKNPKRLHWFNSKLKKGLMTRKAGKW